MKLKLTVAAFLLSAGSAFAGCYTPELELSIDHNDEINRGINRYNDPIKDFTNDVTFGISLNIPLGKTVSDLCAAEINQARAEIKTEIEEEKKKRAERREKDSRARAQELDNLQQKIEICSEFELDTAPKSIKTFCGDLLQ